MKKNEDAIEALKMYQSQKQSEEKDFKHKGRNLRRKLKV